MWSCELPRLFPLVDCGIARVTIGWSSMWMEPNKRHDNVLCPRLPSFLLPIGALTRSVLPAILAASGEKSHEFVRRSFKRIHTTGSARLAGLGMETTAVNWHVLLTPLSTMQAGSVCLCLRS